MMGRGKKGRGAPALSLFPIAPCALTIPYFFLFLMQYSAGASPGWGVGARGQKALSFFSKK